jgi:hypothetical protein
VRYAGQANGACRHWRPRQCALCASRIANKIGVAFR